MTGRPPATGADPRPVIADPSEKPSLYWGAGSRVAVRLAAAETAGRLGVTHFQAAPGEAAPLHRHTHEDEIFLVAQGSVEVTVDGQHRKLIEGGVAFLPRGSAHGYQVIEPAQFFVVTVPGGFERFFAAAGLRPEQDDPAAT